MAGIFIGLAFSVRFVGLPIMFGVILFLLIRDKKIDLAKFNNWLNKISINENYHKKNVIDLDYGRRNGVR